MDIFRKAFASLANSDDINLKFVMRIHSLVCIVIGIAAVLLPHGLLQSASRGNYDHLSHEFVRLYGSITLCIGWFVWSTQDIRDGRLMRAVSETFAICYSLQALVMFRAQFSDPSGHSLMHWMIAVLFLSLGSLYGHVRIQRRIKGYELPGHAEE
jgi:hypothetical protein